MRHGVKRSWRVVAAVAIVSSFLWAPPAIAVLRGPVSPLPVKNVIYGLYMHGPPDIQGLTTAPQQPLGAPIDDFYRKYAPKPVSEPVAPSGGLPPWSVIHCESKGSYTAENPISTASGRYQIVDGTWDGYGGYQHASDAPPSVQDARAREIWANGAGKSHWRECL